MPTTCSNENEEGRRHLRKEQDLGTGFGDCKVWNIEDVFKIHSQEEIVEHSIKDVNHIGGIS